jgi:hypothetical protein
VRSIVTILTMLVVALGLGACGGGDDDGGDDAEVEAREAVADFLDAFSGGVLAEACRTLTPDAQDQVSGEIARFIRSQQDQVGGEAGRTLGDTRGECTSVLRGVLILFDVAPDTAAGTAALADEIRSGGDSVTVEIAGTTGTVTMTEGDRTLTVEVAEVDGEWLVADTRTILFGEAGAP